MRIILRGTRKLKKNDFKKNFPTVFIAQKQMFPAERAALDRFFVPRATERVGRSKDSYFKIYVGFLK